MAYQPREVVIHGTPKTLETSGVVPIYFLTPHTSTLRTSNNFTRIWK